MAGDANCGFMLWDGESKGTITNVFNLLSSGKKVLLYIRKSQEFFKVLNFADLQVTLHRGGIREPWPIPVQGRLSEEAQSDLVLW